MVDFDAVSLSFYKGHTFNYLLNFNAFTEKNHI